MRPSVLVSVFASLPLAMVFVGCGSDPTEAVGSETDTDTDGGTGTGTDSGVSISSTNPTTATNGEGTDSGGACTPGETVDCACPDGMTGTQTCNPDGNSFGACDCPMATTADESTTDPTSSTTDDVTTGPTTGPDTDGTTTGSAACDEFHEIEMMPSDATLSGGWELGESMVGEGEIAVNQMGDDGTILFEPDIPCEDTWYIWVRAFDSGADDSYFATLDGDPNPPAIFEGDCTGQGQGYDWALLNWRDANAGPCEYEMDPWAPMWTAGVHQIEFAFRESPAMGRILVTNDPDLVPN